MKKLRCVIYMCLVSAMLLLSFSLSVCAAEKKQPLTISVDGFFYQTITMDDVYFDPSRDFSAATTHYNPRLARASTMISLAVLREKDRISVPAAFGFENIHAAVFPISGEEPLCTTNYVLGEQKITRNGKPCTLLLAAITPGCECGVYFEANVDFLTDKDNPGTPDLTSGRVRSFTDAAELIYSGYGVDFSLADKLDALEASGEDYIVWITGYSRGAAVANYLGKLLIDRYGTEHVSCYCAATPNVDRAAADSGKSS